MEDGLTYIVEADYLVQEIEGPVCSRLAVPTGSKVFNMCRR